MLILPPKQQTRQTHLSGASTATAPHVPSRPEMFPLQPAAADEQRSWHRKDGFQPRPNVEMVGFFDMSNVQQKPDMAFHEILVG